MLAKKKKTIIAISILGGLFLLVGIFWLGRISVENRPSEPKNNLPPQKLEHPDDKNQSSKNERKLAYLGMSSDEINGNKYAVFSNSIMLLELKSNEPNIEKTFYINQNHPRIKQLLSENKLQKDKQFTIRCGKKLGKNIRHFFDENNQELEIIEV